MWGTHSMKILHCDENEWATAGNNIGKIQKHLEWKKPCTKENSFLYSVIYMFCINQVKQTNKNHSIWGCIDG